MTGCELIKCEHYIDGKCHGPDGYVNKHTGYPMCYRNDDAIPVENYNALNDIKEPTDSEQQTLPGSEKQSPKLPDFKVVLNGVMNWYHRHNKAYTVDSIVRQTMDVIKQSGNFG